MLRIAVIVCTHKKTWMPLAKNTICSEFGGKRQGCSLTCEQADFSKEEIVEP